MDLDSLRYQPREGGGWTVVVGPADNPVTVGHLSPAHSGTGRRAGYDVYTADMVKLGRRPSKTRIDGVVLLVDAWERTHRPRR